MYLLDTERSVIGEGMVLHHYNEWINDNISIHSYHAHIHIANGNDGRVSSDEFYLSERLMSLHLLPTLLGVKERAVSKIRLYAVVVVGIPFG